MALNAAFGDGYEIYQNDVEQGLKEPCFLIAVLQPEITPMLGRRFIKRNPFDIQYFPTNPRNNAEMFTVAETMMEALDFITLPSGDLLHRIQLILALLLMNIIDVDEYLYQKTANYFLAYFLSFL